MTRLLLVALLLSLSACGGEAPAADAGQPLLDAGRDASSSSSPDAAVSADAGQDAHVPGEDGGTDAGSEQHDGCVPPPCPPPPAGCHYEGATACTCGTLICAGQGCTPSCDATKYCDLCADEPSCVERPAPMGGVCPGVWEPVCGCDGQTYGNNCQLLLAGIALMHTEECESTH